MRRGPIWWVSTMHMALGAGIKEAGIKNESAVPWDIIKDMKIPGKDSC